MFVAMAGADENVAERAAGHAGPPLVNRNQIRPPPPALFLRKKYRSDRSPGGLESNTNQRGNARSRKHIIRVPRMLRSKRSRIPDDRDDNIKKVNLDNLPRGYPRLAEFTNSDGTNGLFRRFGSLHTRALLYKQVELSRLEQQLEKLDRDDASKEETSWRVGHSIYLDDGDQNETRKALMEQIETKMKEYDNLLLRDTQLRQLKQPSERIHRNFMDYVYTENSLGEGEKDFIYHEKDFVVLNGKFEDSWLDEFIHRVMGHCRKGILRTLFVTADDQAKTSDQHVHFYSEKRMGILLKVIVAVVSTALLFIPVFVFTSSQDLTVKSMAGITLVFAFFFATAVSVFTSATRQEVFAATATYCAVLTVFIGNLQQNALSYRP